MPPSKVPNSVAKLVIELADQQKEPAEIAQILNLKKVQVSTLLAYHKQLETKTHEAAEPTEVELPEPVEAVEIEVEPPKKVAVEAKDTATEEDEEETTKDTASMSVTMRITETLSIGTRKMRGPR